MDLEGVPGGFNVVHRENGLYVTFRSAAAAKDVEILLPTIATNGKIFGSRISSKLKSHFFQKTSSRTNPSVAIFVTTNIGQIFLINVFTKEVVNMATLQGDVVWVGCLQDLSCVAMVERKGKIVFASYVESSKTKNDYLRWTSFPLDIAPIACSKIEDKLLLSDGSSCLLCYLSKPNGAIRVKPVPLSIPGVIEFRLYSACLSLVLCDGSIMKKSFTSFEDLSKKLRILSDHHVSESRNTKSINSVLKEIRQYSELLRSETKLLQNLNVYLEQMSIAKLFASKRPKNFITVTINALPSYEIRGNYVIRVTLRPINSAGYKFQGRWWRLKLSLSGSKRIVLACPDVRCLNNESFVADICIDQTFSNRIVNAAVHSDKIMLEVDINFSDFSSEDILYCINIYHEPVDLFLFLYQHQQLVGKFRSRTNFENVLSILYERYLSWPGNHTKRETSVLHQSSTLLFSNNMNLVRQAFPFLMLPPILDNFTSQIWLKNIPITFIFKAVDGMFKLSFESSSKNATHLLKFALEKRVMNMFGREGGLNDSLTRSKKSEDGKTSVNLPITFLVKHVGIARHIFDLEKNNIGDIVVSKRILCMLNNVISSIPL